MIRALAVEYGKAVLISSHILTELAEICDTVAIIEHGQLLAVGTVDEIQRGQAHKRGVRMRVLDRAAELLEWLSKRDDVYQVELIEKDKKNVSLTLHHAHQISFEACLLREIIEAGFDVISYGGKDESLEDVFMNVTKGRLQ